MKDHELLKVAATTVNPPTLQQLAKTLGVTPQFLYQVKAGARKLTADQTIQLAEMAGLDAGVIIARHEAERAKSDRARRVWSEVAGRLSNFCLAAGTAAPLAAETLKTLQNLYIMSTHSERAGRDGKSAETAACTARAA